MWTLEVFKARAFRLALGFALAISVATAGAFAFIYWQVSSADVRQVGAVLVDEAAKSVDESETDLRRALELRLTRDIRRLDFVALINQKGQVIFGNVPFMPRIPIDAKAHFVNEDVFPDPHGDNDPAIFVARRRADADILLLGRSLREDYDLQETLLHALAIALLPTILLILAIGVWFAYRASQRFKRVHDAIVRIMNGDLDVRTPLAVARAKLERALNSETGIEQSRGAVEAALAQIDKVSGTISAILRISAVGQGGGEKQFKDFDLVVVCAQLLDFYEPLAESKGVAITLETATAVPLRGDQDLMREALSNLIDNAIKFTPAGGAVRIEARMVDGRPFALVSDTGVGIPAQERTKIFDRFYRGERSGQTLGHGLGLSIAETIANLHGFALTVEDNNPGARFELRAGSSAPLSRLTRQAA